MRKPQMSVRIDKWSVKQSTYDIKYDPKSSIKSHALVDFMVDFSDDLQLEVEWETQQPQKKHGEMETLYKSSIQLQKNMPWYHTKIATGEMLPHPISCEFNASNNEA